MKQNKIIKDYMKNPISKSTCQTYIDEIYANFKDAEFIQVNVESSKHEIKFFLQQVTNYVTKNKNSIKGYDYHHIAQIYGYYISKGWINIYKSMELFLRKYYPYDELTKVFLEYNIKNGNTESMQYKLLTIPSRGLTKVAYNREIKDKKSLAHKLERKGSINSLLSLAQYNYSINRWNSNRRARKAAIEVIQKAHNPNDKLKAIDLLLTHQIKVNYKFKSNFDIYEVIEEVKKYEGYKGWMSCLHTITINLIEGYGCKIDRNKAKEVFAIYSGYSLDEIKDDNRFDKIIENYYQNEYKNREKELNLK